MFKQICMLVGILGLELGSSCGPYIEERTFLESRVQEGGVPPPPSFPCDGTLAHVGSALCESTKGYWHNSLRTCMCPVGTVFCVEHGCQRLEEVAQLHGDLIELPSTLKFWLPERSSADGRVSLQLPSFYLTGYMYSEAWDVGRAGVSTESDVTPEMISEWLSYVDFNAWESPFSRHLFRSEQPPTTRDEKRINCIALRAMATPTEQLEWSEICEAAVSVVDAIASDSLQSLAWTTKQLGLAKRRILYEATTFKQNGIDVGYRLFGKPGTITDRNVILAKNAAGIEIAIAPNGDVFGGRTEYRELLSVQAQNVYADHSVYFNRDFLRIADRRDLRGDRWALQHSVRRSLEARESHEYLSLPTDSSPLLDVVVHAMIADRSIDLRISALAARFALGNKSAQRLLDNAVVEGPLLLSGESSTRGIAALAAEASDHGTNIAGILLADFPCAQASLFDVSPLEYFSPARLREAMEEHIAKTDPQVVNISYTFTFDIPSCEEVFDPIFRAHRDDVLFVVAAGNYGERESPEVCPASLAWKHPNVLSVAGTDESGKIHWRSNWGPKLAKVTAPFCVDTIAPLKGGKTEPEVVRACGTSFSAPFIGNKALKMLARDPGLTPQEVAYIIINQDKFLEQNH